MQGAENWSTGRDLDFSITQQTCLPGRVCCWKQPSVAQVSLKRGREEEKMQKEDMPLSFFLPATQLQLTADCNDLCCPLLETADRGHVHFHRACILYFCAVYRQMGRWPALITEPGVAPRQEWSVGSRWDGDGWEEDEAEMCV